MKEEMKTNYFLVGRILKEPIFNKFSFTAQK